MAPACLYRLQTDEGIGPFSKGSWAADLHMAYMPGPVSDGLTDQPYTPTALFAFPCLAELSRWVLPEDRPLLRRHKVRLVTVLVDPGGIVACGNCQVVYRPERATIVAVEDL